MVKETEYYEVLGIAVDATESDVKRAYRRLALRYHPDKNPNDDSAAEMFKKIGHAYEILSDEEKRRIYDQHGASGLENGGGGADFDPSDIFSMFFGGGRRPRGEPKPKDLVHELKVPLEDMYNGKIKKVSVVRDRLCGSCGGNGMRNGAQRRACTHCNGSGVQVIMHQLFPGMHQRMETTCSSCRGQGTFVRPSDTCDTCRGRCIVKDKKILEVPIEKGAKPKDVIRFEGEGDEIPGVRLKGDVLMFLEQRPHDHFRRVGNHLIVNHTITLQEALCGFQLPLEQLDQRPLLVTVPPGQVIDPEAAWVVHREGMPVPKTGGTSRGNLVIHFNVEYPSQLSLNQIQNIASAFDVHESNPPLYGQRVTLSNESQRKRRNQRNRNANARRRGAPQSVYEAMNGMDEEAFNQRGHAVQCAHQ